MISELEAAILDYVNHLNHDAFFEHLLERATPIEIARAVVDLTASDDRTSVSYATSFAEDGGWHMHHVDFHRQLIEAGFLDTLRANLNKGNYFIRRDAVAVIGGSFPDLLPDLAAIIPHSLENDPLLLSILLREAARTPDQRRDTRWEYIYQMVASPSYLTRWAAVEVVTSNPSYMAPLSGRDHRVIPPGKQILRMLANDVHEHVRTEARFRIRELEAHDEGCAFGPSARRRLYRTIAADAPDLTFGGVKQQFANYCWYENVADYDLALLNAWIRYQEQHPVSYVDLPDRGAIVSYYHRFTENVRPRSSRGDDPQQHAVRLGPK